MKKAYSSIVAVILTLAVAMCAVMSTATVAFAAENADGTKITSVQPRVSVVYPISGSSSGYFSGLFSSNNAKYGRIPAGTYYFDYSFDAQNHAGTIVIESDSERIEKPLVGNGSARSTESFSLQGGTYTVKIIASTGSYGIEKYYAYNLILQ